MNERDLLDILYLNYLSKEHTKLTIADFLRLNVPPLQTNQYLIKRFNGKIVAYATWAFLDDSICTEYAARKHKLQPKDWQCGSNFYLVNCISPFGYTKVFMKELINHVKNLGVTKANYYVLKHKRAGSVKL